jgi:hypothetical protein
VLRFQRILIMSRMTLLTLVVAILPSTATFAAPFCAVFWFSRQCLYYNVESCQRAAGNSGACVINQDEFQPPLGSGNAPFCVVRVARVPFLLDGVPPDLTAAGTQCYYYDAASCSQAAASSGGACVVNR